MDMILIGGAAVGLVMGSFGYVLIRFGLRPVLGYRRLKRRLSSLLNRVEGLESLTEDERHLIRRLAVELQTAVDDGLPQWYILALKNKEVHLRDAVRHLQTLANCKGQEAIHTRAQGVRTSLKL